MRQQHAGYTKLGNREDDVEENVGPDVESGLGQDERPPSPSPANVDFAVRIKTPGEKEVSIQLSSPETKIKVLKQHVERATETKVKCQRLVFAGRILNDDCTVGSYSIVNNSILHLFPISEEQADANIAARNSASASTGGSVPRDPERGSSAQEEMQHRQINNGQSFFHSMHLEHPSLLLWRARVKIISIVCIFYFSLALMDELPVVLGLQSDGDFVPYGEISKDSSWYMPVLLFALLSHLAGIIIALHGIRATHTLLPQHAKMFFRGFNIVIFLAGIQTGIETYASYKIVASHHGMDSDAKGAFMMTLGLDVFVRLCLWAICWATAKNFYDLCRERDRARSVGAVATA